MASEQELSSKEILDTAETMRSLHISRRTLDRYVSNGRLKALYLPSGHRRFRQSDVLALLTSPSASAFSAGVEGVSLSAESGTP